jgi:Flp pilus assembly protein TadG
MALVMAMIVVVLITMLVAGAISFTGTERGAAALQERGDQMSSCIQAARNLFLSRIRTFPVESVEAVVFNETLSYVDENGVSRPTVVVTNHFSGTPTNPVIAELKTVQDAKVGLQDPSVAVEDISNTTNTLGTTRFFAITAVCRETNPNEPNARNAEREVEFLVRVGF